MPGDEQIRQVKERAMPWLLAIPGVVLVGLGSKEVANAPTGQPAIKVYVRDKRPADRVPPGELIPPEIEGVPTDVIHTAGGIRRYTAPEPAPPGFAVRLIPSDPQPYRPLIGGARIRRAGTEHNGTLGCIVEHATDPTKVYALTNHHVVTVEGRYPAEVGVTEIGQPNGESRCSGCCSDTIGTLAAGTDDPDLLTDEALIELPAGTEYVAEILETGPGRGRGVVKGEYTLNDEEQTAGTYPVRKRGAYTRLTGGVVGSVDAGGPTHSRLLVINANPNPAAEPGVPVLFSLGGDSGSAVVNDDNRVVGLLIGGDEAGHSYAYPIRDVLERLSTATRTLRVATATARGDVRTVPGAAMVAVPPEVAGALGANPATGRVRAPVNRQLDRVAARPVGVLDRLHADLATSSTGRRLLALWERHERELNDLLATDRRIKLAWHREGGAALVQLLIRMPDRLDVAVPDTVHGQPIRRCLGRLYEAFRRAASARLRRDLDRAFATLPELAGRTYPQIIAALALGHGAALGPGSGG